MGLATGISAARMLELANGFLVSGHVDENGNLILANGGGQTQNAGNVKGPKGDIGLKGDRGIQGDIGPKGADAAIIVTPMSVTDLPSAYLLGISTFSISDATTNGAWPSWPGTVETIRHSVNRTIQIFAEKTTGKTWIRTENDTNGWGSWNQSSYVGHTHNAGTDIVSGTLAIARLEGSVPRGLGQITSVVDWNTLTSAGSYDVNTLGANSPSGAYGFGVLDITIASVGGSVSQKYYAHGNPRSVYQRVRYGATSWSVWSEVSNWSDLQTNIAAKFSDVGTGGGGTWLPPRLQPTASLLAASTDIKSIKTTGFYRGTTITNAPSTSWWYFEVIRHDDNYVNYMAYEYFGDRVFRAYYNNGTWVPWALVASGDTGWVDLSTLVVMGNSNFTYSSDTSNWGGIQARRHNGLVQFVIANIVVAANYFGASPKPTPGADGNVPNQNLITSGIPAQFRPPLGSIGTFSNGSAGAVNTMYITDTGLVTLAAIASGATLTAAITISGTATYFGA